MAPAADPDPGRPVFDPDLAWQLHPQVSVRPERFGALLYHFGTRRLSFLKTETMVALVKALADHPDARAACRAAGVTPTQEHAYFAALGTLAQSSILIVRDPAVEPGADTPEDTR